MPEIPLLATSKLVSQGELDLSWAIRSTEDRPEGSAGRIGIGTTKHMPIEGIDHLGFKHQALSLREAGSFQDGEVFVQKNRLTKLRCRTREISESIGSIRG